MATIIRPNVRPLSVVVASHNSAFLIRHHRRALALRSIWIRHALVRHLALLMLSEVVVVLLQGLGSLRLAREVLELLRG